MIYDLWYIIYDMWYMINDIWFMVHDILMQLLHKFCACYPSGPNIALLINVNETSKIWTCCVSITLGWWRDN